MLYDITLSIRKSFIIRFEIPTFGYSNAGIHQYAMKISGKTGVLFLLLLLGSVAGLAQEPPETFSFDRTSHDFGELRPGRGVSTVFTLNNTGSSPLLVVDVRVSCNCVKVNWPRRPILPGEKAELTVTYKDRQPGAFYKVAEIITNGNPQRVLLRLKGSIAKR